MHKEPKDAGTPRDGGLCGILRSAQFYPQNYPLPFFLWGFKGVGGRKVPASIAWVMQHDAGSSPALPH